MSVTSEQSELTVLSESDYRIVEHVAREKLTKFQPSDSNDDTVLLLESFLDHLDGDGQLNLSQDIASCSNDDQLRQHARSLVDCVLLPMKAQGGKTPGPSMTISPRLGVEESLENLASMLDEPASRTGQACLKAKCLERDGNRCCISGFTDKKKSNDPNDIVVSTECAHIIPFSLGSWKNSREEQAIAKIWVSLNRCFPVLQSLGFTHETISDPQNAITMDSSFHIHFGTFDMALEAMPNQPNTYTAKSYIRLPYYIKPIITFTDNGTGTNLPRPELLWLHATIARILHLTGKGDQLDKILRDKESTRDLASDGSTDLSRILSATTLRTLSSQPIVGEGAQGTSGDKRIIPIRRQPVDKKKENVQ
ncbi:hypothetical protein BDV25DRAFT_131304 [Aspergillus avenaceus]|uniref:HNH nuclease domain-containing protein n=1 Tax=Aspergillus avenaceus TaxID=36643 RepID=A0A5N6TPZ2_ASPAV|nr:hypothetical protein BDV25DRAFT_131304 [Aspergillus avenaceus]